VSSTAHRLRTSRTLQAGSIHDCTSEHRVVGGEPDTSTAPVSSKTSTGYDITRRPRRTNRHPVYVDISAGVQGSGCATNVERGLMM
jgi:hypothetical protein